MNEISVIIPVKNRARLLKVTLNNILNQTLPPSEIIVVDDGSEDDIEGVKRQYKDNVIFLDNAGKGPGAARNTGLGVSTGKYIQFFDSDDLMTLNKLESQYNHLLNGADMVYSPYIKAEEVNGCWKQRDVILNYYRVPSAFNLDLAMALGWNTITQACMFKADLIKEVGPWNEKLMTHEDYLYLFKLVKAAGNVIHEDRCAVIYRQHQVQLTRGNGSNKNVISVLNQMKNLTGNSYLINKLLNIRLGREKKFQERREKLTIGESIGSLLFESFNYIGRKKTGLNWNILYGPSDSKEQYEYFMNLANEKICDES